MASQESEKSRKELGIFSQWSFFTFASRQCLSAVRPSHILTTLFNIQRRKCFLSFGFSSGIYKTKLITSSHFVIRKELIDVAYTVYIDKFFSYHKKIYSKNKRDNDSLGMFVETKVFVSFSFPSIVDCIRYIDK